MEFLPNLVTLNVRRSLISGESWKVSSLADDAETYLCERCFGFQTEIKLKMSN